MNCNPMVVDYLQLLTQQHKSPVFVFRVFDIKLQPQICLHQSLNLDKILFSTISRRNIRFIYFKSFRSIKLTLGYQLNWLNLFKTKWFLLDYLITVTYHFHEIARRLGKALLQGVRRMIRTLD